MNNLLGLFEPVNMNYEHERQDDQAGEPSIAEMTAKVGKFENTRSQKTSEVIRKCDDFAISVLFLFPTEDFLTEPSPVFSSCWKRDI